MKGSVPATTPAEPERRDALARGAADDDLVRTMLVALEPAAALERILGLGLDGLEPRTVACDRPLTPQFHEGKLFYERTRDGVVLWRRPEPRYHGRLEHIPYPDVLDVRIEAVPRGSRIELRWRRHPLTRIAARWTVVWGMLAWVVDIVVLATMGLTAGPLLLCVSALALTIYTSIRFRAVRRALRPLVPRVYELLAPYELGAADVAGSAFRVLPARSDESPPPGEPRGR